MDESEAPMNQASEALSSEPRPYYYINNNNNTIIHALYIQLNNAACRFFRYISVLSTANWYAFRNLLHPVS